MHAEFSVADKRWGLPVEGRVRHTEVLLRRGASRSFQISLLVLILAIAAMLASLTGNFFVWISHRLELLFLLGGIACWRWSWFVVQAMRAILYRYRAYPRLRRAALDAVARRGPVPGLAVLAVTYRERPWITRAVFGALFRELSSVRGLTRAPKVVVATGSDDDDEVIRQVFTESCGELRPADGEPWPPELVLVRDGTGKRPAMATALREIVADKPQPDSAVVFMDGDTLIQPGLLGKVLPLFRLQPEVAAVTTDETGWTQGPRWFAEWVSLRFGLRHRTMCSGALSGRLLCLTGRFSVFRGNVASDPTFCDQIERDMIHHWLWDSFQMLSGDDKSTWYWLAARGRRMLYVPDALVTTFETVSGQPVRRALANVRRWSGNSLRHNWRALLLGPKKLGWFGWYSLLDQRLAIGTVLVGPVFALLALCAGRIQLAAGYVLWVLCSRLAHAAIAWQHGRRLSVFYLPLQIASDWTVALSKLWVLFHPAKQAWLNRGGRLLDSTRQRAFYRWRAGLAHYLCGCVCAAVVILIGLFSGLLPVLRESPLFLATPEGRAPDSAAFILETFELFGQQPAVSDDPRVPPALTRR